MSLSDKEKTAALAVSASLVILAAAATVLIFQQEQEAYSVDEAVEAASQLDGENVEVQGEAVKGRAICTQMACFDDNPCCNTCSAQVKLEENRSIILRGEEIGCSGNNCQVNCTPETGKTYLVKGTLENGRQVSINVSNYTEVR